MRLKKKCEVKGCNNHTKSKYGTCSKHSESSLYRRYRILKRSARYPIIMSYQVYCDLLVYSNFECYYCGADISNSTGHCLDRMNNKNNYNIKNVVVCCKHCNHLKGEYFSFKVFKKLVDCYKKVCKIKKKPTLGGNIYGIQKRK